MFGIKFVLQSNINHKFYAMKKSLFIYLLLFLFCFSHSFSQKKHINHNSLNNIDFMIHFGSNDIDVFFGQNSYREMYFDYKPRKRTWRLKKDVRRKNIGLGFGLQRKVKVLARFENPNGGRDFTILLNRRGYWRYSGPNKWFNVFKKKVIKNL